MIRNHEWRLAIDGNWLRYWQYHRQANMTEAKLTSLIDYLLAKNESINGSRGTSQGAPPFPLSHLTFFPYLSQFQPVTYPYHAEKGEDFQMEMDKPRTANQLPEPRFSLTFGYTWLVVTGFTRNLSRQVPKFPDNCVSSSCVSTIPKTHLSPLSQLLHEVPTLKAKDLWKPYQNPA